MGYHRFGDNGQGNLKNGQNVRSIYVDKRRSAHSFG